MILVKIDDRVGPGAKERAGRPNLSSNNAEGGLLNKDRSFRLGKQSLVS